VTHLCRWGKNSWRRVRERARVAARAPTCPSRSRSRPRTREPRPTCQPWRRAKRIARNIHLTPMSVPPPAARARASHHTRRHGSARSTRSRSSCSQPERKRGQHDRRLFCGERMRDIPIRHRGTHRRNTVRDRQDGRIRLGSATTTVVRTTAGDPRHDSRGSLREKQGESEQQRRTKVADAIESAALILRSSLWMLPI